MNRRQLHDRTLYCERCGLSFLWSREEQERTADDQNASPTRPQLCPGCRQLLPNQDRERGLVKWFNHRKHYGFLIRSGQPDLFVHRSALRSRARLRPGDLVEFTVVHTERGPVAGDVTSLMRGDVDSPNSSTTRSPSA
jgi:cold shock CspA family protein